MKRAVYAGSFDPLTNGHMWLIKEGSKLFDEVIVAIGVNNNKKYTFTLTERMQMLKEATKDYKNIKIDSFENDYLIEYASKVKANYILRGIRSISDYEYEKGMRNINNDLRPSIETVFLICPRELSEISSSLVKSLIGFTGWQEIVRQYIPTAVYLSILEKFDSVKSK